MTDESAAARLTELRAAALRQLTALSADHAAIAAAAADSNLDDEHDPEGATIAFEREQIAALRQRAEQQIAEADAAMDRVRTGSYGRCETCGRSIAAARLEALPAARRCVTCASARTS